MLFRVWLAMGLVGAMLATRAGNAAGIDEFAGIKVIHTLPRTSFELERAHRSSGSDACERIAEKQSLELTSFLTILTERDRREAARIRPMPTARQSVLSVGLTMDASDRADLPTVSRGSILDYLDSNYVAIQVRVRRDLLDRKLYFHHRPLAVTAQFRGSRMTQKFEPVVANAINDFHSIGLFAKEGATMAPENLRTLVLLFKNSVIRSGARTRDQFEFAFIRGKEGKSDTRLDSHVFVTSRDRSQLTYLKPYSPPTSPNACSIRGSIVITDFDSSGIYPKESATRSFRLDARRTFPMSSIEAYCKEQSLVGGLYDNLDQVLDALIDEQIEPAPSFSSPSNDER